MSARNPTLDVPAPGVLGNDTDPNGLTMVSYLDSEPAHGSLTFNSDGSFVADPFYNAMGSGYIADALRTAHAADPNAKLYLNDYNIEGENAKSNAMYSLVQSLLAQGVPINGVGFESHYILGQVPSSASSSSVTRSGKYR